MNIKVLGGGCCRCENLLAAVKEAVAEKGIEAEIEYITDIYVNGEPNLQNPPESAAESIRLAATLKKSADNGGTILPF